MSEFFQALTYSPLIRNALLAGLLASVACGVVGSYVVTRRITYLAGGIAHCVLGGMGAALYLNKVHHWPQCLGGPELQPLHGAIAAALVAALVIGVVSLRFQEREDTVISALWAIGMAAGVLFLSVVPGYKQDLMSYLFGNILMVSPDALVLIAALDVVVVVLALLFYKQFLAICFDEEFARTRGVRVEAFYLLLLCLTALTTVLLVTVVGIVMVIALLTLPVAVAGLFAGRLWQMMLASALLSMALTTAGLALSYAPSLPPGATIIVLAGAVYLVGLTVRSLVRRLSRPATRDT